jgi:penicillin-binding protein 1C
MLEVERPGEELAWRAFGASRPVAWKTGTSYGFRDAWAVGVTPRYVVGVWAGNADGEGRPGLTGYSAAAPILFELFGLLPAGAWFKEPAKDLVVVDVCRHSGMRAGPHCAETRAQVVTEASLAAPPCLYCRVVHRDATGNWQVHGDCEPVAQIQSVPWFVLPPAMETYYRRQHADYVPLPPLRPDCRGEAGSDQAAALSFIYPKERAQVYVPIEMGGGIGRVVFEAAHRDPESRVFWHLDDAYYGETRDIHQIAMAPTPGKHVLTIVDEAGQTARRAFTVLARSPRR